MNAIERFSLMVRLSKRAWRAKRSPGALEIVGLTGRAQTAIDPRGTIFIRGVLWSARTETSIARGQRVRVTGIDGHTMIVEPDNEVPINLERK